MVNKQQIISNQRIIDSLNTDYGINCATLDLLPLGADLDSCVYKAASPDGSVFFVKIKRGQNHNIGAIIQQLLHDAGIQQIIPPVNTKYGQPTQYIDGCTIVIYPFIEGQDGFSRDLTNDQWVTLGKALRQIHEFELPPLIKNQIKCETYSPKWRQSIKSIYNYIDSQPIMINEIALKLFTFMQAHREIIQRLTNRAEQLAQKIQIQSSEFVLCHSDIHGGNVLMTDMGNFYIVDWDQPIMAPKERDLMFIGGGIANAWNNPQEEMLFYKGYGKTEINREILTYYRHERIVEDIAIYCQHLFLTKDGEDNRTEIYDIFTAMFKPHGVVDIAFKTDNEFTNI